MNSVSVIIPWGKVTGDIKRSIQSALEQSLKVDKIFVMSNGVIGGDEIRALRDCFDVPIVNVYKMQGCRNANVARNYGAALSSSTWVAYLDSDDWWDASHLEQSIDMLRHTNSDFIYSGMRVYSKSDKITEKVAEDYLKYGNFENYLLTYLPAQTSSYVIKREAVLAQPWDFSLRRHQDYEFIARLARYYSGCSKRNVTVNVDWSVPTKHNDHIDCFKVLDSFKNNLIPELYDRHIYTLLISAVKANDYGWIKYMHRIFEAIMRIGYRKVCFKSVQS